jgi:hypothetical protein
VSEIDFNEIEKAMAELVNKAQGQKRQSQLKVVTKARNEQAKKIETAHEQGNLATKRIIIAGNRLRSNAPAARTQFPQPTSSAPRINTESPLISDFKAKPQVVEPVSVSKKEDSISADEVPIYSAQEENLSLGKSVGDLSNDYLLERISESNDPIEDTEPETDPIESYDNSMNLSQEESEERTDDEGKDKEAEHSLESITGPPPLNLRLGDRHKPESKHDLPEADEYSNEVGRVHKMYGQHLPNEYHPSASKKVQKYNKKSSRRPHQESKTKGKEARGFMFYFFAVSIALACLLWLFAVYLYFFYV